VAGVLFWLRQSGLDRPDRSILADHAGMFFLHPTAREYQLGIWPGKSAATSDTSRALFDIAAGRCTPVHLFADASATGRAGASTRLSVLQPALKTHGSRQCSVESHRSSSRIPQLQLDRKSEAESFRSEVDRFLPLRRDPSAVLRGMFKPHSNDRLCENSKGVIFLFRLNTIECRIIQR
jgi:hypothetical protein